MFSIILIFILREVSTEAIILLDETWTHAVFELLNRLGVEPFLNCFLNPSKTLSNYVLGGQHYVCDLHHNFDWTLTVKKFNPQLIFLQFKHCFNKLYVVTCWKIVKLHSWCVCYVVEGDYGYFCLTCNLICLFDFFWAEHWYFWNGENSIISYLMFLLFWSF